MRNSLIQNKAASISFSLILLILFATPFIFFRESIQQLAALGYIGLFFACLLSNISVLLPSSSTLFVLLASSALNPLWCVILGSLGASLGEQCSYLCGRTGRRYFEPIETERLSRFQIWLQKNSFLTVVFFAFIPLPLFDIVGIIAGANKMRWINYFLAVLIGKLLKFATSLLIALIYLPWAAQHLDGFAGDFYNMLSNMLI